MSKRFLIIVLVIIGMLIFGGNVSAQTNMNIGDYLTAAANFYGFLQGDVASLTKLNIANNEVPVVFYIAKTAGVSPVTIANSWLSGKSWADISNMFGIKPDVYYVPPTATVSGPPYGKAWGYYKKWPKNQWTWKNITLTNADITNIVNLKFLSKHYGYPMGQIVSMRAKGVDFKNINNNIVKAKKENADKAKKEKSKVNKNKNVNGKNQDKGKSEKNNDKHGNNGQGGNEKGKGKH